MRKFIWPKNLEPSIIRGLIRKINQHHIDVSTSYLADLIYTHLYFYIYSNEILKIDIKSLKLKLNSTSLSKLKACKVIGNELIIEIQM